MKEHIAIIIEGRILNAKESKDKDWIKKVSLQIAEDILKRDERIKDYMKCNLIS